jgi:chaperone required for assembly of F1-ATPase
MKDKYEIELTPTQDLTHPGQNVRKFVDFVTKLNPVSLTILYKIANTTSSVCLGVALMNERITIEEALNISFLEQDIQIRKYGKVDQFQDLDRLRTSFQISSAKVFLNLS